MHILKKSIFIFSILFCLSTIINAKITPKIIDKQKLIHTPVFIFEQVQV